MFNIAFNNPKYAHNVGQIARTAELCGATHLILCGNTTKIPPRPASDTAHSLEKIRQDFPTAEDMIAHYHDLRWKIIGVELDHNAIPLAEYQHEEHDVVYLFGSERDGLSQHVMDLCDDLIVIPSDKPWSHNVSQAVGIVMGARMVDLSRVS